LAIIGIGVISKIFLARLLSATELGIFIIVQTLFGMLVFFASLGMTDTIARFVGVKYKQDLSQSVDVLSRGLRLVVTVGILIAIIIILLASTISEHIFHASRLSTIIVIIAVAVPFKLAVDLIGSANQGAGKLYYKILLVDLVSTIMFTIGLGLLLVLKSGSLNIVVVLYMVPFLISLLLLHGQYKFTAIFKQCDSDITAYDLLRYSIPLLLSGIVAWPLTLVPVIIGRITSVELVSYYSLAISLASFIYLGASASEAAGLSVWSSYLGAGDTNSLKEDYRLITRWGIVVGSVVFVPLIVCPREVVIILFSWKFEPVAHILPAVSCIFFVNLITGPTESILKAYGDTRFIFSTRLAVGIVVLLTLYPFLTIWGLNGAIAVYGLSVAVGITMYSWHLYKQHSLHPIDRHFSLILLSICSAALATLIALKYIPRWGGYFVYIISAVVVYCSLLVLHFVVLQAMAPRDRLIMSRIYNRICAPE